MPHIEKKHGKRRWIGAVMVKGKRRTKLFPDVSKASQRAAASWEAETRKQLETSQTIMESLTLGRWVNDYLSFVQRRGMAKKVYNEKKLAFKKLVAFEQREKRIFTKETLVDSITKFQIKSHFDKMVDAGRSGNAVLKDRKNLGAAWNWGKDNIQNWPLGENPVLAIPSGNYPKTKKPRYVPPDFDFWQLHDWLKDRAGSGKPAHVQDYAMFMVALHVAARRGEMFRMRHDDLDFARDKVRLWTRKRKDGSLESDWLPMTKELKSTLLKWIETRGSVSGIEDDTVFVCVDEFAFAMPYFGKSFTARQHAMKRWCKKVGIKHFGFHAIRHFTASTLFHKGYPVAHLQAILRHKSPHTTERYLRSLELSSVRPALEEGLKRDAQIIPFPETKMAAAS